MKWLAIPFLCSLLAGAVWFNNHCDDTRVGLDISYGGWSKSIITGEWKHFVKAGGCYYLDGTRTGRIWYGLLHYLYGRNEAYETWFMGRKLTDAEIQELYRCGINGKRCTVGEGACFEIMSDGSVFRFPAITDIDAATGEVLISCIPGYKGLTVPDDLDSHKGAYDAARGEEKS